MKVLKLFALGICFVLGACSNQSTSIVQTNEHGTQWSWDKGTIVVKTPERPAGQTSAIGLTVPKMEVVRTELTHFTIILIINKILVKNILMVSYLYHLRLFSSIILCKASICIIAPS